MSLDGIAKMEDVIGEMTIENAIIKLTDKKPSEKITVLGISFNPKPIFVFAPALTLSFLFFLMASIIFIKDKQQEDRAINEQIEGLFIFHKNNYGKLLTIVSLVILPLFCKIAIIVKLWDAANWKGYVFSITCCLGMIYLIWHSIENIRIIRSNISLPKDNQESANISLPSPLSNLPTHDKMQTDAKTPFPPNS